MKDQSFFFRVYLTFCIKLHHVILIRGPINISVSQNRELRTEKLSKLSRFT